MCTTAQSAPKDLSKNNIIPADKDPGVLAATIAHLLSPEKLFAFVASLVEVLLPQTEDPEQQTQGIAYAKRLVAIITAHQFRIAQDYLRINPDTGHNPDKKAETLKRWLTKTQGMPASVANSLTTATTVAPEIDVQDLIGDGTLPLDVLTMAVRSTRNHLKEDLSSDSTRQVFTDLAQRLKLKTVSCESQGRQVTKAQARWAVRQVLNDHPEKVKPTARKTSRTQQQTVYIRLTTTGKIEYSHNGTLLKHSPLKRRPAGWVIDDATVREMYDKDVAIQLKVVSASENTENHGEQGSELSIVSYKHNDSGMPDALSKLAEAQERRLARQAVIPRLNRKERRRISRAAAK